MNWKHLLLTATACAAAGLAQEPGQMTAGQMEHDVVFFQQAVPPPGPGPMGIAEPFTIGLAGGNAGFVSAQIASPGAVKASPYSAESVVESTQTLPDGNRIVHKQVSKQYRDGEGRERREFGGTDGTPAMIMISDPVSGATYTLNPRAKTADKLPMPKLAFEPGAVTQMRTNVTVTAHTGEAMPGQRVMMVREGQLREGQMTAAMPALPTISALPSVATSNAQAEDLGARSIEGVMATGKRFRNTIPAGQIGNERPIETSTETWYSPDLKMTVLSKTSDPRSGETTVKLTNISRAEPARALFEVPSDYKLNELPRGDGPIQIMRREIKPE